MGSRIGCLAAATILLAGCGDSGLATLPVTGTVRFAGRPVPAGRIDFLPDAARGGAGPAGFAAIKAGRFDTRLGGRGVAAGPYLAVVRGTDGKPGATEGQETGRSLFAPFTQAFVAEPELTLTIDVTAAEVGKP